MGREIKKKTLDDNPLGDDSLDEQLTDDWSVEASEPFGAMPEGPDVDLSDMNDFDQDDGASPGQTAESSSFDTDFPADGKEPEPQGEPATHEKISPGMFRRLKASRAFRISLVSFLFLILVGSGVAYWYGAPQGSAEGTDFIKHPIQLPSYQQECKFLILANTQNTQSLVHMVLTIEFRAVNAQEQFRNNALPLRDCVYEFLEQSQTSGNSKSYWQRIVEKDLFANLKARFPSYRIGSVRLTALENL